MRECARMREREAGEVNQFHLNGTNAISVERMCSDVLEPPAWIVRGTAPLSQRATILLPCSAPLQVIPRDAILLSSPLAPTDGLRPPRSSIQLCRTWQSPRRLGGSCTQPLRSSGSPAPRQRPARLRSEGLRPTSHIRPLTSVTEPPRGL